VVELHDGVAITTSTLARSNIGNKRRHRCAR
jgi:hypothetical protein